MNVEVRRATIRALPVVTALLAEMDSERPLPLRRATALYRKMRRYPGYHVYLAYGDGLPIGTFSLLVIPTLMHDGALEALVDAVVVAPEYRGNGIGRQMMRAAMRIATKAGCYKLALSSNLKREDAHRFYRNLGFRQHGISFSVPLKRHS